MRILNVLHGMRKEKRVPGQALRCGYSPLTRIGFAFLLALLSLPLANGDLLAASGDRTMGTRSGQAEITRDPATGDRVMATPDPKPEDQYQGPQTIIVAPEVYPNQSGGRPPRPPQRPQPR